MSRTVFRCLAGGLGMLLLTAVPLLAHHNVTGKFDPAKTRTLNGVVTRLDWANPHVHILMDVIEGNTVTNWAVELESTLDLERSGWDLNTLRPGDVSSRPTSRTPILPRTRTRATRRSARTLSYTYESS